MSHISIHKWALIVAPVYLLVCGGFSAYLAYQKGRSLLEGFLFGLILGPIGIAAVGLRPKATRRRLRPRERGEQNEISRLIAKRYPPQPRNAGDECLPVVGP